MQEVLNLNKLDLLLSSFFQPLLFERLYASSGEAKIKTSPMPINFRNKELQSHKQDLEIAFRNDRKVKRLSRRKSLPGLTYWFVRLSTTKPHRMGGWNNGNLFSQSSRGCKSKMRAGLPWGLSPCLPGGHPLHLAFLLSAYIPAASFCVSISSYSHTGLWPILMTSF